MAGPTDDEIILEITKIGDVQRVAAVHAMTGTEVVVQAPVGASLADVRMLALRKLQRALEGASGKGDSTEGEPAGTRGAASPPRPGKWV